ncbi:hypothetical protein CDV52_20280 [Haematobacter missouriensis]|uniref:Transposase DDE domain-containing protein n=1 Tax=Haematobacter missouriensis TaxID=366616 RepID=A0A225CVF6_9RHOB|nr:hypothetical protein CDV53_08350 [Haematobacter missouriensis]OWJ80966.1 hypothetical protein CDV52_20280 [Haematobacter missouriensis]
MFRSGSSWQTTGMVASILSMAGIDRPAPSFSSLSRRHRLIKVNVFDASDAKPLNLTMDGIGTNFLGDGE